MALKIYFCDGCNESIPLKDINENRITIDAGKIYCSKCAPKKPSREVARSSLVVVAVLVALIGFGFGLVALLVSQQIRDLQAEIRKGTEDLAGARDDLAALRREAMPRADAEQLRQRVLDDQDLAKKELAGQSDRIKVVEALVRTEVGNLEKRLGEKTGSELTALAKSVEKIGEDGRAHAAAFEALKGSIVAFEGSLGQLRAELDAVRARRGGANGGAGTDSGPTEEVPDDSSKDLLMTLKDPDAMKRFAAVMELARFRSPAVIEALVGMLQDPESYVRDGSVRTLRKINSPHAIPAIIKALRDDDFFVRSSAREALKAMTDANVTFDAGADATERERQVRDWEAWWAANQERLLRK
jgi:HEAT repeats